MWQLFPSYINGRVVFNFSKAQMSYACDNTQHLRHVRFNHSLRINQIHLPIKCFFTFNKTV